MPFLVSPLNWTQLPAIFIFYFQGSQVSHLIDFNSVSADTLILITTLILIILILILILIISHPYPNSYLCPHPQLLMQILFSQRKLESRELSDLPIHNILLSICQF